MVAADPGTIVVFSDITCPFAHVAIHRLHEARRRLGVDVSFDLRAFPIELVNGEPRTRRITDVEVGVLGRLAPDAGWEVWTGPDDLYPNSVLLPMEAVLAAKPQGRPAGEELDLALRRAFWTESACIQNLATILEIADGLASMDAARLRADLAAGVGRRALFEDWAVVESGEVSVSPHLFLADGSDHPNPGMEVDWHGEPGSGFPIIASDEPLEIERLVKQAAS